MLAESWTICRYLAKKYDLVGSNDWESAQAEMYVDVINDLRLAVLPAIRENDATKKAQLYDQAVNEKVLPHLRLVEKHLENNGGSYLIGESFTWADLAHFNFLSVGEMVDQFPDLLKETPLLKQLIERLADVPNVKHWLETRPKTVY